MTTLDLPRGSIRTQDGRVYRLTSEDLLWLGRAAQFEGGDNAAATLWTYAQRWALLRWRGSLASLVRAHSQTVNPAWASREASGCRAHPTLCTPTKLARRHAARTIAFSALRSNIQGAVLKWANAELDNPVPRAVDYADRAQARRCLDSGRCSNVVLDARNVYLTTTASDEWPQDFVTLLNADGSRVAGPGSSGTSAAQWAVGLTITATLGWFVWRYVKR